MKTFEELFEILKNKFNEEEDISTHKEGNEDVILIAAPKINLVATFLKNEPELNFDSLILLTGVDDENGEKTTNEDGSFDLSGGTLSVYYHLESTSLKHKLILKTSVPRENPVCPSVALVWRGSDWHEREAYDLIGLFLTGTLTYPEF